jgi:hypothetical protein
VSGSVLSFGAGFSSSSFTLPSSSSAGLGGVATGSDAREGTIAASVNPSLPLPALVVQFLLPTDGKPMTPSSSSSSSKAAGPAESEVAEVTPSVRASEALLLACLRLATGDAGLLQFLPRQQQQSQQQQQDAQQLTC